MYVKCYCCFCIAPEEQSPPSAAVIEARYIIITWYPPEKPNGVLSLYRVYRDGALIASVLPSLQTYNDTNLFPFTTYEYQIEALNVLGSVQSESIFFTTQEAAPEEVNSPYLQTINDTSILANWTVPNITNGIIELYNLSLVAVDGELLETPLVNTIKGTLTVVVTSLVPFTTNTFILTACTDGGCSDSKSVSIMTAEAAPDFQPAPAITSVNSSALSLDWTAPPQPNGVIQSYEIYIRYAPFTGDGDIVTTVNSTVNSITVQNLEPFTTYEFSVIAYTGAGGTQSDWASGVTDEASKHMNIYTNYHERYLFRPRRCCCT